MNGGFLVTKIKQLGDRVFERVLLKKGIDAFNGAQGRILYALWQEDGVPIKTVSENVVLPSHRLLPCLKEWRKAALSAVNRISRISEKHFSILLKKHIN